MSFISQHATDHARLDILKTGGVSVTDVTWVMVITWSRVLPRMYLSVFDSVSESCEHFPTISFFAGYSHVLTHLASTAKIDTVQASTKYRINMYTYHNDKSTR